MASPGRLWSSWRTSPRRLSGPRPEELPSSARRRRRPWQPFRGRERRERGSKRTSSSVSPYVPWPSIRFISEVFLGRDRAHIGQTITLGWSTCPELHVKGYGKIARCQVHIAELSVRGRTPGP